MILDDGSATILCNTKGEEMRFRKTVKLGKGIKLNLSKSGPSVTVGGKGLSFNIGKKGIFMNTSIPGTGLYDRKKIAGGSSSRTQNKPGRSSSTEKPVDEFSLAVSDEGDIIIVSPAGYPITDESMKRRIRATERYKSEKQAILDAFREDNSAKADEFNRAIDEFINIHTLSPRVKKAKDFTREVKDSELDETIEEALSGIELPVEFAAGFQISGDRSMIDVDLDLPECEDMPFQKAVQAANGCLKITKKAQDEVRRDYRNCVFSLAVYIAAIIFNISPVIQIITVSGYTQRRNTKGDIKDVYIFAERFDRTSFEDADLKSVDPYEFCMSFENRCNLTQTMSFRQIEPYDLQ
ncbi:MAG: DUF4236 domain-containing protein [Eubacteriaceae bacterium]|nr:DUF4236 domain-containing protein [Eubacteriaceae bacterium]